MKSCFTLSSIVRGGYQTYPRLVGKNLYSPINFDKLTAQALHYFYTNAHFVEGPVKFDSHYYQCDRGQLILTQSQLADSLKISERDWRRVIGNLKEEQIIDVQRLKYGSLVTLHSYDLHTVKTPKVPAVQVVQSSTYPKGDVGNLVFHNDSTRYPEHNVQGCEIAPIEF